MDLFEEYKNSDDKIQFFENQNYNQQLNILKRLDKNDLQKMVSELSIDNIKQFFKDLDYNKKKEIVSMLSKQDLKEFYKMLTPAEKGEVINLLERQQAAYLKELEEYNNMINSSADSIQKNSEVITKSEEAIRIANNKRFEARAKLVDVRENAVKIAKAKKALEKKVGKLTNKSYVGWFKKRNLRKLKEAQKELKEVNADFNKVNQKILNLNNAIENYSNVIKKNNMNIDRANARIEKARDDSRNAKRRLAEIKEASSKLNAREKAAFGRIMFHKKVYLRGHFLETIKKREMQVKKEIMQEQAKAEKTFRDAQKKKNTTRDEAPKKKAATTSRENNKPSANVASSRENNRPSASVGSRSQFIRDMIEVISVLSEAGLIQYPNNVQVHSNNNRELLENPTATISSEEMATILSVVQAMYDKKVQEEQKRQQQQVQVENRGRPRTRQPVSMTGMVNITVFVLIFSIVVIILGILLIINI